MPEEEAISQSTLLQKWSLLVFSSLFAATSDEDTMGDPSIDSYDGLVVSPCPMDGGGLELKSIASVIRGSPGPNTS